MTKEAPCHGKKLQAKLQALVIFINCIRSDSPGGGLFSWGQTGNIWNRLPGNQKFPNSSSGQTEHVTDPPGLPCRLMPVT